MHQKLALGQTQWELPGYSQGSLRTLHLLLHGVQMCMVECKAGVCHVASLRSHVRPCLKNKQTKPGVVAHTSVPRSWKTKARQLRKLDKGIPGYI